MKKSLSIFTSLVLALAFTGCVEPEDEVVDTEDAEVFTADCDAELDYSDFIQGFWVMTLTSPGLEIVGPVVFHEDGRVTEDYANVTVTDNGRTITQHVTFGGQYGYYDVEGDQLNIEGAGNGMWGTFTDEEHMTGTIIDVNGQSAPWSAYKVAPYIVGEWNMTMFGWGEGEYARHHNLVLNEDGTAYTDWVKVQFDDGEIAEGDMDPANGLFSEYALNGGTMMIESANQNVIFTGEMYYSDEGTYCGLAMSGTWTNFATGESGEWYASKKG